MMNYTFKKADAYRFLDQNKPTSILQLFSKNDFRISWSHFSSQTRLPDKKNIKVSCSQIKALILSCGKTKAHGEDRQGQSKQPPKDKHYGPYGETGRQEDEHGDALKTSHHQ